MPGSRRVSVTVDADVSPFNRGLLGAVASTKTFARELESADGRMAGLIQTGMALAPALVPIGAAVVPAIAGLTLQLGLAAGAAGVAVLAFNGVGDSLTALNDYQVKPTAENFAKLQQTMDTLGPAGQEFVLALDKMAPEFQRLQDLAQQGLLPGVTDGLDDLLTVMPQVQDVIFTMSSTLGDLSREAGKGLAGPEFREFFDYLNVTARPVLTEMGRTLGNFLEGTANMVMAFDPLSRSFSTGLLDMSRSFAEWSDNLDQSQGFQDFVDYVQKSGPAAGDALGSLANALIQLVEAAAPVGTAVLPVIAILSDGLAALADSSVGPALITTAAAVGVLGRSMSLLSIVGLRNGGFLTNLLNPGKIKAGAAALTTVTTATDRARLSVTGLAAAEAKRTATFRAGAAQLGKNAALLGGLALATSGLADKTGLSNTASMALMGTIVGPLGTAIGGAVGLTMDLAAANNDVEDAMERAEAAARSSVIDFGAQGAAVDSARAKFVAFKKDIDNISLGETLNPFESTDKNWIEGIFGESDVDELKKRSDDAVVSLMALRQGAAEFYAALKGDPGDTSMLSATNEEMTKFVNDLAPAFQAAGLDIRDVLTTGSGWAEAKDAVRDYAAAADSASGRSKSVAEAMADMGNQMGSNVTQAEALKSALDSLFGPGLNQSAATDAWAQSLKDLREQLAGTNGALRGNSDAALANRAAIRDSVQSLSDRVAADAAVEHSGEKAAEQLLRGRDAILKTAVAAGVSKKEVGAYLKTLGMTPESLATIITQPNMLNAQEQVKGLGKLYGLTPKQVRTVLQAIDKGMSPTQALKSVYDKLDGRQIKTLLQALTGQAESSVARFSAAFDGLDGRVARTFIETTTTQIDRRLTQGRATGGRIGGRSPHKRADNILISATAGEYMQQVDAVDYYGVATMDAINQRRIPKSAMAGYAYGGKISDYGDFAQRLAGGGPVRSVADQLAIAQVMQQIRDLRRSLNKDGKDKLEGLNRKIAQLQLEVAQKELRLAKTREAREDRAEAREKAREDKAEARETRTGVRAAGSSFASGIAGLVPDDAPATVRGGVNAEIAAFRKAVRDAGGVWTRAMREQAASLRATARELDATKAALTREQAKRDALVETLASQQQALDQLTSTMESYSATVSGKFLTDPFNGARTVTTPGSVDPTLASNLSAAEAQLIAIRNSATGDDVASAALASSLIPQIEAMRAEVERQSQPVETMVSGLAAMREELTKSTADALAMADALKTLAGKGLDTTGPLGGLYASLAASGDFATASELASLSAAQIDEYEKLFATREDAAAAVGALATQAVYGQQQAQMQTLVNATTAAIGRQDATIVRLEARIATLGAEVRQGAADGVAGLQGQLDSLSNAVAGIKTAVRDQPKQARDLKRGGRGRG